MFSQHGSLRVIAADADLCGMVGSPSLPLPLNALAEPARSHLGDSLEKQVLTG